MILPWFFLYSNIKAVLSQWKPRNAALNLNTNRNLQRHRAVLRAIARLFCCYLLLNKLLQRAMSVDGSSERWHVYSMVSSCCCDCRWHVVDSCSIYRLSSSSVVSRRLSGRRSEFQSGRMPNGLNAEHSIYELICHCAINATHQIH